MFMRGAQVSGEVKRGGSEMSGSPIREEASSQRIRYRTRGGNAPPPHPNSQRTSSQQENAAPSRIWCYREATASRV